MRNLARVGLVLGFLLLCAASGCNAQESAFCVDSSSGLSAVRACKDSGWVIHPLHDNEHCTSNGMRCLAVYRGEVKASCKESKLSATLAQHSAPQGIESRWNEKPRALLPLRIEVLGAAMSVRGMIQISIAGFTACAELCAQERSDEVIPQFVPVYAQAGSP